MKVHSFDYLAHPHVQAIDDVGVSYNFFYTKTLPGSIATHHSK